MDLINTEAQVIIILRDPLNLNMYPYNLKKVTKYKMDMPHINSNLA